MVTKRTVHSVGSMALWIPATAVIALMFAQSGCEPPPTSLSATATGHWSAIAAASDSGGAAPDAGIQDLPGVDVSDVPDGSDAAAADSTADVEAWSDGEGPEVEVGSPDNGPGLDGSGLPDVPADSVSDGVGSDSGDTDSAADTGQVRYLQGQVHSPITASVAARLQDIAAGAPDRASDVFMKVGASGTVNPKFLTCFAGGSVAWGATSSDLESTRAYFLNGNADGDDPFSRQTLAAKVGMSAVWAVSGDPSPVAAETAAINPRFALIAYGTNDMQLGTSFQSAMWNFANHLQTLVDTLIDWGVVPVLQTNGARLDNLQADRFVETYNTIIRGVAQSRQVPLMDMWTVMSQLPNWGKSGDGLHLNTSPEGACAFDPIALTYGYNARNVETLRGLHRARLATLGPDATGIASAAEDPVNAPPQLGSGTAEVPYVVDMLPYVHSDSTWEAPDALLDVYPGCGSLSDQSGPERYYSLVLEASTRLRFMVHDQGDVDVDLHILSDEGGGQGCIHRAHQLIETTLPAGTYTVVVDSWVDAGGDIHAGDYLLGIVECHPDDTSCD